MFSESSDQIPRFYILRSNIPKIPVASSIAKGFFCLFVWPRFERGRGQKGRAGLLRALNISALKPTRQIENSLANQRFEELRVSQETEPRGRS